MSGFVSIYKDMTPAEKEVASFLTKHLGIYWTFEQPVCVGDEKRRPRIWSPDFYLPDLGLYIEVCGSKEYDYVYREGIYKDNKIPVIFVHLYKEEGKWQNYLIMQIKEIHGNRSKIIERLE
ncbi:MAG: hypothetical protein WED05_11120 [Candidatus Atabeyarchaeum deiterrae]